MNRLDMIRRAATDRRRRLALGGAARVLEGAREKGLALSLIGSLTGERFGPHSDADFFVHGPIDPERRAAVERLVAGAFRGTGIPYDIVYEGDLTPERAREFLGV